MGKNNDNPAAERSGCAACSPRAPRSFHGWPRYHQRRAPQLGLLPAPVEARAFAASKIPPCCIIKTSRLPAGWNWKRGAERWWLWWCYAQNRSPCNSAALSLGVIVKLFLQEQPNESCWMFGKTGSVKRKKPGILFG